MRLRRAGASKAFCKAIKLTYVVNLLQYQQQQILIRAIC